MYKVIPQKKKRKRRINIISQQVLWLSYNDVLI